MADGLRMVCPNLKCRLMLTVPGKARGKTVRCRQCGMRVHVPGPEAGVGSGTEQRPGPAHSGSPTQSER